MESTRPTLPGTWTRIIARIQTRREAWFLAVALAVVALDQSSKWIIRSGLDRGDSWPDGWHIRIVHFVNTGAAFGIFQNSGPLLVITSVLGVAALIVYLFNPGFAHPIVRLGLALMLGGAIGNLVDRVARGEVVDFLKVPRWPAFNVADSAITIGVLCLLWAVLWMDSPENEANTS
jgi:signal peptidase II